MELERARVDSISRAGMSAWNQVDDDKMDALTPHLSIMERVAAFPAMDDPERNLLILYRLDPAQGHTPTAPPSGKPTPNLRCGPRMGQQPSVTNQLVH